MPEWTRRDVSLASAASGGSLKRRSPDASLVQIDPSPAERRKAADGKPADTGDRIERTWRAVMPWLLVGWLMGVLLSFVRLGGGIARLHVLRRRSTIAPPSVTREFAWLARRLGIAQVVEVRVSGEAGIPLTFGTLRPVVLLPRRFAADLRADQVRLVLAHELAHVARRDYLVNLAQCLVEALLFFHPVAHRLSRISREEREHCCDELAASVAGDRREVARALVALEELVGVRSSRTLAPAATGGILLRRIERLVTTATPPGRFHTMLSLGMLVIAVALVVLATPASARIGAASLAPLGTGSDSARLEPRPRSSSAPTPVPRIASAALAEVERSADAAAAPVLAATPDQRGADGFSVVWGGGVGPGERLRVRNLVGSIRVVPVEGNRATLRARVSGGVLSDLVFQPTRDAEGLTVCALRGAHGRCDAEGYTWFATRDEMHRVISDLVMELPVGASITAASFEGDLVLDGVSGDVEARTGSGAITTRVVAGLDHRTLEFHTGAGEVRVALPPGFGGTLQARLSDGLVEHEMPLAPLGEFSPQRMHASLGPGGNRMSASSGRGSLVLVRSP